MAKMTKRRCVLSLFLIIVITLVSISSVFALPKNAFASSNIFVDIKNSSFESTSTQQFAKPFATDWIVNDGNFVAENINVISTNAYDKNNYWQFKNGTYFVESQDFIQIDDAAEYLFGVKFIFSNINDSCKLSVKSYNAQNEFVSEYQGQTIISKQEYVGKWQETVLKLALDSQAIKVKILIEINAQQGSVGIDNVNAYKNFIKLDNGASICLEKNLLEIRFTAKLDIEAYQMLSHNYHQVSVGMVLSPKQQVNSASEFTVKGISLNGAMETIDVDHWNNPKTYQQDGYYTYYCAFGQVGYDLMEDFLDGEIVARAYIKYTESNKEKYIYSTWDMVNNCRSIRQVAQKAKQDERVYNSYTLTQKEIISAYIEGRVPNFDGLG